MMTEPEAEPKERHRPGWPAWRRLLVFQIKIYIDALRDLLLSPLSLIAFILDAIKGSTGPDSYFEQVLHLGRRTERAINLFNQHDGEGDHNLDTILASMEEKVRSEFEAQKKRR
ncbi:MAG: hypothetical protein WD772_11915 [Pseudohongiellaceae bacterium]